MRFLLLFLTLFLAALPAQADAIIDDLHISRDGEVVNIRVSLRNPGPANQAGPLRIELFGRPHDGDEWQPLYSWNDITGLAAGNRVSRDFFSVEGDTASTLALGEFEVKAVLSGPNVSESVQKFAEHDPDHHH